VSVPGVDVANKIHELNIKSDLEIEYVDADGNSPEGEPISLRFLNGKNQNVTLDSNGKVVLKNVPLGPFRADQTKRK
jgi:hypothetical protein